MSLRGKRILVTGATGFVGSNLIRHLLGHGADVACIVRPSSNRWRLDGLSTELTFIEADLANKRALKKALSGIKVDGVFHLAASGVNQSVQDFGKLLQANVWGSLNLLELSAAEGSNLDFFVNTGTCHEYGLKTGSISEKSSVEPTNIYAASKAASTILCSAYALKHEIPLRTVRPFVAYGPFEGKHKFVPAIIVGALKGEDIPLTSGEQARDFIFVDDLIAGFIAAALKKNAEGQVINLGSGREVSLRAVAQKIISMVGKGRLQLGAIPHRQGEMWHLRADISKAKRLLGWQPKVGLEAGLKKTINWYADNLSHF